MRVVKGVNVHNDCPPPPHYGRLSRWLPILTEMAVGEYFDVDTDVEKDSIVQCAKSTRYSARKYSSVRVFVRTQRQHNGKYRIWRVEEK